LKKIVTVLLFSLISTALFAQNEVGNDGDKLIWILLVVLAMALFFYLFAGKKKRISINPGLLFKRQKLRVELEKDRVYYPDRLRLKIKNTGNTDLDIDRPLLIFDRFWIKRNFRINGSNNRTFYPLYLYTRY